MTPFQKFKELVRKAPDEIKFILFANKSVPQRKDKHPEGNVLKHIMIVTMRALEKYPNDMDIILAAFFHDLGKYATVDVNPKSGEPNALGHEDVSAEYVDKFSDWIFDMGGRPDIVEDIVKNHMEFKILMNMKRMKQTEFYGKKNFEKLKKFSELDRGGWFKPELKEQLKQKLVNQILEETGSRYMFFSNLEQMKRQIDLLLELDENKVESILEDRHDWAQDHISEAKTNLDQVFDFLMNETNGNDDADSDKKQLTEKKKKNKPTNPELWKKALSWARSRYKVCPSAYCNGAAAKKYKSMGGKWKTE